MKAVPEFVLHEKNNEELNGIQCIKNKHSWRSEGASVSQLQYTFLVGENSVCNVTFTHSVEKFETYFRCPQTYIFTNSCQSLRY